MDRSPMTFRRRRLTVPTHRLREAAAAAAAAVEDQHLDTDTDYRGAVGDGGEMGRNYHQSSCVTT
jgi:hypothetical protein